MMRRRHLLIKLTLLLTFCGVYLSILLSLSSSKERPDPSPQQVTIELSRLVCCLWRVTTMQASCISEKEISMPQLELYSLSMSSITYCTPNYIICFRGSILTPKGFLRMRMFIELIPRLVLSTFLRALLPQQKSSLRRKH